MTQIVPEQIEFTDLSEFEDIEIPCDGPRIWPEVLGEHDDPARWIALKPCGHHRLFCDKCKDAYLKMIADYGSAFTCAECKEATQHFLGFEPLAKS